MSTPSKLPAGGDGSRRVTLDDLRARAAGGRKFPVLTSYDATTARWQSAGGIDVLLTGDTLGVCMLGLDSTVPVTMAQMLDAARAVRRGAPNAYLIGDMPFGSYHNRVHDAVDHATAFLAEAGCDCVKLECDRRMADVVAAIDRANVPVMAHVGLMPQRVEFSGEYRARGRTAREAEALVRDAAALVEAGAVMLLIEAVPAETTERIVAAVGGVPVIGCGAGPACHGFVVVTHDLLGLTAGRVPKFVPKLADLGPQMQQAFEQYGDAVRGGRYPAPEHCYPMKRE